jgi:hypothetical protein
MSMSASRVSFLIEVLVCKKLPSDFGLALLRSLRLGSSRFGWSLVCRNGRAHAEHVSALDTRGSHDQNVAGWVWDEKMQSQIRRPHRVPHNLRNPAIKNCSGRAREPPHTNEKERKPRGAASLRLSVEGARGGGPDARRHTAHSHTPSAHHRTSLR